MRIFSGRSAAAGSADSLPSGRSEDVQRLVETALTHDDIAAHTVWPSTSLHADLPADWW